MRKNEISDHKRAYPVNFRWGVIGALLLSIGLFTLLPSKFDIKPYQANKSSEIKSEKIEMKSEELTPPKEEAKPAVPIEAESEEEVEAQTIAETEFEEVYTTPEDAVEAPIVEFYALEEYPEPKYNPQPTYPRFAREKEWEGKVIVRVLLRTDGTVERAELKSPSPYETLNNAALEKAREWTFTPAKQRGRPVRVWVNIPFTFTLEE